MNITLKKGLDLNISGKITDLAVNVVKANTCAIVPDDFNGFVPKLDVKEGDTVKVGSPLMHDKAQPDLLLVAPLSGTVKEIVRGERRKIMRVVIAGDNKDDALDFNVSNISTRQDVINLLGNSGLLASFRRRPYDTVPKLDIVPRDIFVTTFDTAPLALSLDMQLGDDAKDLLTRAVKALSLVTSGKIYISRSSVSNLPDIEGAVNVIIDGRHPAGNVGSQIAAISPVNKGETVWTLDIVTLYKFGKLLATGHLDTTTIVGLCGPEVKNCKVFKTTIGAELKPLIQGNLADDNRHQRIISGNVLTGTAVDADEYLRAPYRQISVIAEGDDVDEFMGWASLSPKKMSVSKSFPGHFLHKLFSPDARILGGRRAMIMSGEYDKVIPMDIMAEYLLKAIISRDIDEMEQLGIYEVAPEDFALAEYVDTSKMPLQQIVRDGLDYLRKELE
jgi:Na+-transporting NADH:ubiquinone oxidoreductase subunit A